MVCKYSWLTFNTSSARHKLWLSVREERGYSLCQSPVSSVPSQTQSDLIMVLACFNVAKVYSLERVSSFDLSSPLNWTLTKFSFLYKLWKFPSLNAHNLIWGRFHQDMSHSRLICRTVGVWERCERFGGSRGGPQPSTDDKWVSGEPRSLLSYLTTKKFPLLSFYLISVNVARPLSQLKLNQSQSQHTNTLNKLQTDQGRIFVCFIFVCLFIEMK